MKRASREPKTAASAEPLPGALEPGSVRVAYHDGPPAIHFAGLPWRRGVAQGVTAAKWAEMRARGDFREFDFRPQSDAPAATATTED